MVRFLT